MSFDNSIAQKKRSRGNSIFDNEIVISGMSGKFPNSRTIEDFEYNLYNKVDMIDDAETRWKHFNDSIPKRMGKINDIDKFDATFFGVHYKQAQSMDPLCRLIMETAYEAVLDAGINPKVLRGTKTGVFVAACQSETEQIDFTEKMALGDFGITGTSRSMIANRISYALGLHGPSMIIDSACSSSMYALDAAFNAIKHGECDAAIVGGTNLLLYPHVTLQFVKLGNLSPNGNCRPFDNDANGTVRSEAICAILLQRSKDAKRIYSTIVSSRTNYDGYKFGGITAASATSKTTLLEEIYNDNGVSPNDLAYLETNGTGMAADDLVECQAIANVICENRNLNTKPLLIGSVKSNMGHAEACSSLASIVKVLLAFERGTISPNINFNKININSRALVNRQLKVCQHQTALDGLLIGINSFGYSGANAHVVLKRHLKEKSSVVFGEDYDDGDDGDVVDQRDLPRLVKWAGRTEEAITVFHEKMESIPLDLEYLGLLNNIQCEDIAGYFYRGYGLYRNGNGNTGQNNNACCLAKDVQRFTGMQRPIVWVFSGMGSQWNKMGESLLKLSVFRESLQKSHNTLRSYGVDLLTIITSTDECIFKNILNSFIGIAAIQIGIVDTLRAMGMDADLYIGHSFGELACAYADGCFTLEQTILSAYYRGLASLETKTINGAIAAIGLGYREVKNRLPSTLEVACHNGPDSSTISGPKEDIEQFVAQLKAEQIFAKEIYVANIAYHSKYIANMGPNLQKYLEQIITSPRKRSSKWLSTSVPKANWDIEENQYSSAQYHTNNLLNFVLFEETATFLPTNCITMEIAPHGLLQPVLKKLLPNGLHIPLTLKGSNDNIAFFFNALGKLYLSGISLPIENLYAPIQYPVSRGTPMISPMIRWEHTTDWYVEKYQHHKNICNGERKIEMSLDDPQYKYIAGNVVDGRCFIPCTGYLHLVWETFAMMLDKPSVNELSVEFEDVKMTERTTMKPGEIIKLTVMILSGTGSFEINDQGLTVSTGIIRELEKSETTLMEESMVGQDESTINRRQHPPPPHQTNLPFINGEDFYRELRLRGYQYAGEFRGVCETRGDGCVGRVKWQNNWVTFLDSILQAIMLGQDTRQLGFLTGFQKITINVKQHRAVLETLDEHCPIFDLQYVPQLGAVISAGIEISGMSVVSVAKSKPMGINLIESYEYVPYLMGSESVMDMPDAINVFLQIVLENNLLNNNNNNRTTVSCNQFMAIELLLQTEDEPIIQYVNDAIERQPSPLRMYTLTLLTSMQFNGMSPKIHVINSNVADISLFSNYDILIVRNCFAANGDTLENYRKALKNTFASYLIARETIDIDIRNVKNVAGFELISIIPTTFDETLLLFQKRCDSSTTRLQMVWSDSSDDSESDSKTVKMVNINILRISTGDDQYKWLNKLKNMIRSNQSILLLSENEEYSGALGLVKCLVREFDNKMDIQLICIEDDSAPPFDIHHEFFQKQLNKNLLINIYRNGQWGHYAYFPLMDEQQIDPQRNIIDEKLQLSQLDTYYFGMLLERGDLTSLKWCPGVPDFIQDENTILQSDIVNVQYVGLNFRDLLYATGQFGPEIMTLERLQQERVLCTDYAGINLETGERIMGMLKYGALQTQIQQSSSEFTWSVPKHWTLRDAVTCPTAYLTVYIAYFMYNPIAKGKSILIHCGSGGIGLAAIHIAFAYGMEVYTTVSSNEKKLFLLETFPELKENNIGNSRDCSFELMIKFQTHGLGVDYVLNQLPGERLHASIRCLGYGGTLLEIGSFDIFHDNKIGLGCFLRNLLFRSVSVYNYITLPSADEDRLKIIEKIQNDLNSGVIQPLHSTEFEAKDLVNAVGYLTTGKHIGKIVIKLRGQPNDKRTLPMEIAPRIYFNSTAVFVVAGGFGEFGLEFIDWMIIRGARKFIINSKTGLQKPFQLYRVRLWESYGCKIIQNALDITTLKNVETLISEGLALGEIDGIFNLTMNFQEQKQSLLRQQSNSFYECIAPKLLGTKYLDELSRKMCPKLKWFIVFSSVVSGRGDIDSSCYGLANSAMEQIIEKRQTLGLPAKAIQWSAIEEIGYTSRQDDARANMNRKGYELQRVELCLKNLDRMLTPPSTPVRSLINNNTKNRKTNAAAIVSSISIVNRNRV